MPGSQLEDALTAVGGDALYWPPEASATPAGTYWQFLPVF